jgi:hypothetical protein
MTESGSMKRLALIALVLFAACEKNPSKLDSSKAGPGVSSGGGAMSAESEAALRTLDSRLKALEQAHTPGAHSGDGKAGEPSLVERTHRLEASMAKYGEALDFLNQVYAQQKAQKEAQEAGEPDPNAVFAVDISKAVQAGQVEGPATAVITIIEAWDFA